MDFSMQNSIYFEEFENLIIMYFHPYLPASVTVWFEVVTSYHLVSHRCMFQAPSAMDRILGSLWPLMMLYFMGSKGRLS